MSWMDPEDPFCYGSRQGALGLLLNLGTVVRMMGGHEMTAHPQLGHCRRTFDKRVLDTRACSLNARACSFEKGVLERRRKGAAATCATRSLFVQGAPWTPRRCESERKLKLCYISGGRRDLDSPFSFIYRYESILTRIGKQIRKLIALTHD